MTDAELLQMLAEKSPREFTTEEIAELRLRARTVPEIRLALAELIEFEGDMTAVLAAPPLSIERMLGRAEERRRLETAQAARRRWWSLIGLTACLLLGVAVWRMNARPAALVNPDVVEAEVPGAAADGDEPPLVAVNTLKDDALTVPATDPKMPAATTPEPTVAVTDELPPAVGPWDDWIEGRVRPLAAGSRQLIGDLAAIGLDRLPRTEFEAWWSDVPQQPHAVHQEQINQRPITQFDGWARLRAPWVDDTRLRFVTFDDRDLELHFWQDTEGVVLKRYRDREPHQWAAFQVRRNDASQLTPNWWGLLTTDSGAHYRSAAPVWDVSHDSGQLRLSAGEVVLLSVPMAELPAEVYLHGKTRLRGFRWVRSAAPEATSAVKYPNVLASTLPAEWDWLFPDDGSMMLQRDADGSVTLTSTSKSEPARAWVPIPTPGLYEALVQIAVADPGTGVYLGDEQGRPLAHLAFARDRRTQQITYATVRPSERREESDYQFREAPPPYFIGGQWLRLVAGLGTCQTACSVDGTHFGYLADHPLRDVRGAVRSLGVFCSPSDTPRTIRLQSAEVCRLNGVYHLATGLPMTEELPADIASRRFEDTWWNPVWDAKPAGRSVGAWLDDAAIATLERGPSRELAEPLVERLCRSAERLPFGQRVELLECLLLLNDHRTEERSRNWAREFVRLRGATDDERRVSGLKAWERWLTAPGCSIRGHRDEFQSGLVGDILHAAAAGAWRDALRTAAVTQVWLATAHPDHQPRDQMEATDRVARWGKAAAMEQLGIAATLVGDLLPSDWRHPLLVTVNKEAYNVQTELQAALENRAYVDASRIVAGLQPGAMQGLLPEPHDPQLLVSLPVSLQSAVTATPEFGERLVTELSPTGWLRVRQAMADGSPEAVERVTLQAWGTVPAAAAHQWLGDRALSLGDPLAAVTQYVSGLRWADDAVRAEILPRLQLAAGLAGMPPLSAWQSAATPGGAEQNGAATGRLSSTEIERTLTQLGADAAEWATAADTQPPGVGTLQPVPYRAERLVKFDGQSGQNAGRGEYRYSDAFGRQFAVAIDAERVYLGNRYQLNAYQRSDGRQLWARGLGSDQGEAHAFPFTPMRPVLAGDRILLRWLAKSGAELVCLDRRDGAVRWTARPGEKSQVLTDPVVLRDAVWAIVSHPEDQEQLQFDWVRFNARTGAVETTVPLLRVRDVWDGKPPVTLAAEGLQFVATLPGLVCRFDIQGSLQWMRRETWLPARVDPLSENALVMPPHWSGDRIILSVPHGRRVLCLHADTGRVLWSVPLAELQGLVHVDAELVLAAGRDQLTAIAADAGRVLWSHSLDRALGPVAVDAQTVRALRRQTSNSERGWVQLVELDRATGTLQREIPWDFPEADDWRIGPWWQTNDGVWALTGQTWRDPQRELVRLLPLTDAPTHLKLAAGLPTWWLPSGVEWQRELAWVLPGWQLSGVTTDRLRRSPDPVAGERPVLLVRCDSRQTVRAIRSIPGSARRLTLRVGTEPQQSTRWVVQLDDEVLFDEEFAPSTESWLIREVTLPESDAATRLLQVQCSGTSDRPFTTRWHRLDLD